MCNCSTPVGSISYSGFRSSNSQTLAIQNCDLDKTVIQTYYNALSCVKKTHKIAAISSNIIEVNRYLGVLQSALNYPDNYCYFASEIEIFQNTLLIRIIEYVPECINQ